MNHLTDDQYFRLEALRLAVQAGYPDHREAFYKFLKGNDGTALYSVADVEKSVVSAIRNIGETRNGRSFGDGEP